MPVSNPLHRVELIQAGYDPDQMDEMEPMQQVQAPVVDTTPKPLTTSWPRALASHALASAPSTAIGLQAGAGVGGLATAIGGPFLGVPAGITATVLGGLAARKAQDALIREGLGDKVNESYQNELATTESEHPTASRIGDALSGLIGLKPSWNILKSAGKVLTNPLKGSPINSSDVGNLANVTLGASAPLIGEVQKNVDRNNVLDSIENLPSNIYKDIKSDPAGFLSEMGIGALLNSPNKLGLKLGLHPNVVEPKVGARLAEDIRNSEPIQSVGPKALLPETSGPATTEEYTKGPQLYGNKSAIAPEIDALNPSFTDISEQLKAQPPIESSEVQAYRQAQEEHNIAQEKLKIETERLKTKSQEINSLVEKPIEKPIEPSPFPNEPDYQHPSSSSERIQPILEGLDKQNLPAQPTTAWNDFWKDFSAKHNVTIDDSGRVFDKSGKEVAGQAFQREGLKAALIKINPNKASLDTLPHEFFHPFFNDLKELGSTRDKAMVSRAKRVIQESPEYYSWKNEREAGGLNPDPVEYLTQLTGEDSIRRLLNTDSTGDIKNWFRDFWAYQKSKFGKGNSSDVSRIMSNRLLNDPSFNERFGENINPKVTEPKKEPLQQQEESLFKNIENKSKEASVKEPIVKSDTSTEPYIPTLLKSENDKIRSVGTPEAKSLATANEKFYDTYKFLNGKLSGVLQDKLSKAANINLSDVLTKGEIKGYLSQDNPLLSSTYAKMQDLREGKDVKFSPQEASIRKPIQDTLKSVRDMLRDRPGIRDISKSVDDPNYIFHITKPSVPETILSDRQSPESVKLQKDFIDYQTPKVGAKQAEANLEKILEGYKSKSVDIASQFGPLDKAEGAGIPKSWRETNLLNATQRYLDRVSRRFAYHDAIESNPGAIAGLERHSQDPSVKTVSNDILGNTPSVEKKFNAAQGIFRSAALGTLTGARDVTSNLTLGWQHQENPWQAIKTGLGSLTNLGKYISDGVENGRIRHNINSLEWSDSIGALRRISDVISDAQGRNFLERISRGYSTGVGELTTLDYLEKFNRGETSKQQEAWFEKFGKDIDWKKGSLTRDEVLKIAGRFTDSSQGSYDYTGLPKYTKEGALSPLLSLSRWNVEKANNYFKNVIDPLRRGNYTPFLMSTLGMTLGGAAVTSLTELITGRKDKTATVKELKEAHDEGKDIKSALAYKALGLASASGYAGILSDLAKSVMDKVYAKVKPRWFNNLTLDFIENVTSASSSLAKAVEEDGPSPELFTKFAAQVTADHLQMLRLIYNRVSDEKSDELNKSNKYRDLRTFNLLEGNKVNDLSDNDFTRSFSDGKIKDFKNEQDLTKAKTLLPDLIKSAIAKAGNDPEKLTQELAKIKRNSYQTMPNPETLPLSFRKYILYLNKTQGEEEAHKRLNDYIKRNSVNEVKSDMVP